MSTNASIDSVNETEDIGSLLDACEEFQSILDRYLETNKRLVDSAKVGSLYWQLVEIQGIARLSKLKSQAIRVKALQLAMSIITNIEKGASPNV